jgi:uncharacterized protein
MTEQEKKTVAQEFIRGLGARVGNLLRSIMTEDVVWTLPGESPMSGEAHGVEAILKRAKRQGVNSRRFTAFLNSGGGGGIVLQLVSRR